MQPHKNGQHRCRNNRNRGQRQDNNLCVSPSSCQCLQTRLGSQGSQFVLLSPTAGPTQTLFFQSSPHTSFLFSHRSVTFSNLHMPWVKNVCLSRSLFATLSILFIITSVSELMWQINESTLSLDIETRTEHSRAPCRTEVLAPRSCLKQWVCIFISQQHQRTQ